MFNRFWAEEAADRFESQGVNPGYTTWVLADMHPYVGKSSKQKTATVYWAFNPWKPAGQRAAICSCLPANQSRWSISESSFQRFSVSTCITLAWFASLLKWHLIVFAFWAHERDLLMFPRAVVICHVKKSVGLSNCRDVISVLPAGTTYAWIKAADVHCIFGIAK